MITFMSDNEQRTAKLGLFTATSSHPTYHIGSVPLKMHIPKRTCLNFRTFRTPDWTNLVFMVLYVFLL